MIETRHDVEAFGYEQELKRSLSLGDLLAYGLVFITPLAPVSVFGIVFNASHGMVPLVYVIGLVAMIFVALSYMTMSEAFPVAGSVYAYASRSLGATVGFFAGWAILLDYILLPTLTFVVAAIAIASVFPAFPKPICIVVMVVLATIVNELGIESTARTSFALLGFQVIVLVIFGIDGAIALAHHAHGAHLSWTPFFNPAEVTPSLIFGALSLAVLSFLGFDAISTLSEESRGGAATIGRATMLSLVLSAALFVAQSWLASQFLPGRTSLAPGDPTNEAFYDVAGLAGGTWLKFLLAVPGVFFSSLAGAVTAQAATARLIYGMARDGELPRALAHVDPRRKVPTRAVYLVAGLTLVLGVTLVDQLELFTSMVSFGALLGFLTLQASVVAYFVVRKRSRNWLRHLVTPTIAFAIVGYVLWNAEANAKIAGAAWMAVGLVVYLIRRRAKPRFRTLEGRTVAIVAGFLCLMSGTARPSAADEVTIARGATFSASGLASALISATSKLECVVANGVCNYHVLGTPKSWAGVPRDAIGGILKNGQPIVSVSLQSPGNGRGHVFLALLWTKVDGRFRFVGYVPAADGGDISVAIGSGDLVVTTSVYGPSDADCCPSHTRIDIDTLDGIALRKLSTTTVPATTYPGSEFSVPEKL